MHAGGVGTTGQVMRAGKPQLVVPFAHDHFDNGVTLGRLGLGESIPRTSLNARNLRTALERLLNDEGVRERAVTVGERVAVEARTPGHTVHLWRSFAPCASALIRGRCRVESPESSEGRKPPMTSIEIRPGPLGTEGGEPFPEVREEMERMEKGPADHAPVF